MGWTRTSRLSIKNSPSAGRTVKTWDSRLRYLRLFLRSATICTRPLCPCLSLRCCEGGLSIRFRKSTPPENRQFNISTSNSKQYVDDFAGDLTLRLASICTRPRCPCLSLQCCSRGLSISFRKSTLSQNRQLNISTSKSKQYVDDFVGELTFQNHLINTFCEIKSD